MTWSEINSLDELVDLVGEPLPRVANKARHALHDLDRQWLAASPFCLVATADASGACDVSPKGDPPGQLAHVIDDTTIAIAERPGNRRVDGYRNVLANPHVGLLFLIPGRGDTLRINGRARLVSDAPFFDAMVVRGIGRSWPWWSRSTRSSTTARRPSCARSSGSRRPGPTRAGATGDREGVRAAGVDSGGAHRLLRPRVRRQALR